MKVRLKARRKEDAPLTIHVRVIPNPFRVMEIDMKCGKKGVCSTLPYPDYDVLSETAFDGYVIYHLKRLFDRLVKEAGGE